MNQILERYRETNPAYALMPAQELAARLHQEHYADRPLAQFVEALEAQGGPVMDPPEMPQPSVTARMGRGMMDVAQGVKQAAFRAADAVTGNEAAPMYEAGVNRELAQYEAGQGQGFDGARAAGGIAALAPAMLVPPGRGVASNAAIGAAVGAGSGGALYTDTSEQDFLTGKAIQTGIGAIGGAAAPAAVSMGLRAATSMWAGLSNAAKAVLARIPGSSRDEILSTLNQAMQSVGVSMPSLSAEVQAVLMRDVVDSIRATGTFDAQALARRARMEGQGYEPMTGQVTRDPHQYAFEANIAKVEGVGQDVMDRYRFQNEKAMGDAEALETAVGGGRASATDFQAGEQVQAAARRISSETQEKVSRAYNAARNTEGFGSEVPAERLRAELTEVYDVFEDVLPAPVARRVEELVDADRTPTVEQVNQALQLVNRRLGNSSAADQRAALGGTARALSRALDDFAEEGDSEAARAIREASRLAARRFGLLRGPRGNETTVVEGLLDGNARVDRFVQNRVINGNPSDLDHLRRFLTVGTDEFPPTQQGRDAWNAIRSAVIRNANEAAGVGRTGGAEANEFNARAYSRFLRNLGADRRAMLFTQEENAVIDMFDATMTDLFTVPPRSPVNYSNTTPLLANLFLRMSNVPVLGDMATVVVGLGRVGKEALEEAQQQAGAAGALSGQPYTSTAARANREQLAEWAERLLPPSSVAPVGAVSAPAALESLDDPRPGE